MAAIVERLTNRQGLGKRFAAFGVAIFVPLFVIAFWRDGQVVEFDKFVRFVVVGIVLASIYGIAATGLVVTYTTSGIFNFAQGAMGMFLAFVYWQLKAETESGGWGIPAVPALILTVLVIAPLLGALIERLVMRRLSTAPLVAQLVATVGLLAFFIGLADSIWASNTYRTIGTFFGSSGFSTADIGIGDTFVPWYRFTTIVVGIGVALALRVLLYRTRLGIAMRAVVDNRDLAALNGAAPGRVSMFSWALGSSMAAVAGILLAQEFGNLDASALTLFVVECFAAAIIGRLRSLPMTLVGGAVIGFSYAGAREFLEFQGRWIQLGGLGVIPGIILFLALLFLPEARIEGRRVASAVTARVPTIKRAALGFAVLMAVMIVFAATLNSSNLLRIEFGLVIAFIMLSLVPLTGWAGQISFAQITFVGVGAWAAFEFSSSGGNAFGLHVYDPGSPWALVFCALTAVPVGLVMALPALRLQGLYLALASMAFGLMFIVVFSFPEVFSSTGRKIEALTIFGQDFSKPFTLLGIEFSATAGTLLFGTFIFCLVGLGLVALRRGSFGRRLIAMRDSPAACATLGVDLLRTKLMVFGLSAAIAGLAGGYAGFHHGNVDSANFRVLEGLPYLLLAVVGGIGVVSGTIFGASVLQVFTAFLPNAWLPGSEIVRWWSRIGPGTSGIAIARQPEGVIPQVGHDLRERRGKTTGAPPAKEAATAASVPPTIEPAPTGGS